MPIYLLVSSLVYAIKIASIQFCPLFTDDASRVVLKCDDDKGSNYINANFVDVRTLMSSVLITITFNITCAHLSKTHHIWYFTNCT